MEPNRIRAIRLALGENRATFGDRFYRTGRTIESWEQGRSSPDKLATAVLDQIAEKLVRQGKLDAE
jgi:DNA-binding transcriptional regulator YiaG